MLALEVSSLDATSLEFILGYMLFCLKLVVTRWYVFPCSYQGSLQSLLGVLWTLKPWNHLIFLAGSADGY